MTYSALLLAILAVVVLYLIGFLLTAWMRRKVFDDIENKEPPKQNPGQNWRKDGS